MSLPFELTHGVEVAIKSLRPDATFVLAGTNIIEWNDPKNRPMPTWEEICVKLDQLHEEAIRKK